MWPWVFGRAPNSTCDTFATTKPKKRAGPLTSSLSAFFAESANFQPRNANLKSTLRRHLRLQSLKSRARIFHNRPALETSHVAMIAIRLRLVIMFLALDVHQVKFIDQTLALQQRERSINGGTIDTRVVFPRNFQESRRIEVPR